MKTDKSMKAQSWRLLMSPLHCKSRTSHATSEKRSWAVEATRSTMGAMGRDETRGER